MFVRIVYRVGLVVAYLLQTCAIVAAEVMASFYRPSSHTFERDTGLSASSPWGGFLSLGTSAHWLLWLCTRRGTRSRWFYRRLTSTVTVLSPGLIGSCEPTLAMPVPVTLIVALWPASRVPDC